MKHQFKIVLLAKLNCHQFRTKLYISYSSTVINNLIRALKNYTRILEHPVCDIQSELRVFLEWCSIFCVKIVQEIQPITTQSLASHMRAFGELFVLLSLLYSAKTLQLFDIKEFGQEPKISHLHRDIFGATILYKKCV